METYLTGLLGRPFVELDENAADDNYPDYVYGEDDDTPAYEELYDDGVDVNAATFHCLPLTFSSLS